MWRLFDSQRGRMAARGLRPTSMALTAQKQLFADRYVVLNDGRKGAGAQAARDAGYSAKAAAQQASRLLKDADVIAYMESRVSPVLSTAPAIVGGKMEADEVLTRLTDIARGDLGKFITRGGSIDLKANDVPLHLLKRVKTKRSEKLGDELEIEMYDALDASSAVPACRARPLPDLALKRGDC